MLVLLNDELGKKVHEQCVELQTKVQEISAKLDSLASPVRALSGNSFQENGDREVIRANTALNELSIMTFTTG
jgi:hypothetical protein